MFDIVAFFSANIHPKHAPWCGFCFFALSYAWNFYLHREKKNKNNKQLNLYTSILLLKRKTSNYDCEFILRFFVVLFFCGFWQVRTVNWQNRKHAAKDNCVVHQTTLQARVKEDKATSIQRISSILWGKYVFSNTNTRCWEIFTHLLILTDWFFIFMQQSMMMNGISCEGGHFMVHKKIETALINYLCFARSTSLLNGSEWWIVEIFCHLAIFILLSVINLIP